MKKDMVVCYTKIINLQKSTLKSIIYSPNFTTNDLNTECVMSSTLEEKTHEKKKSVSFTGLFSSSTSSDLI